MCRTILVATDSSDESRAALGHAVGLAEKLGATVHVVTVLDTRSNPYHFGVREVDAMNDAARELLEDVTTAYDGRDVPFELEILRGNPAKSIVEYAESIDADLIVAGKRGDDGITGVLLGSTTDRLARLTEIPLTIVPADSSTA